MDYEIGGNEIKLDASEGIADIPSNRTLLVEKLTADDPVNPEPVAGLTSIVEVFKHFKPELDIEFENEEGQPISENFHFLSVGDFGVKNLTENSNFLNDLKVQEDFYNKLIKQLRSNKVLQRALDTPEAKTAFIDVLKELSQELENNKTI